MRRTTDRPDDRCDRRHKERTADNPHGQSVVLPVGTIVRSVEGKFFVYIYIDL